MLSLVELILLEMPYYYAGKPRRQQGRTSRSTPTLVWCKTLVSLSRGQFVRDKPRTINSDGDVDENEDDKGGAKSSVERPHRCEDSREVRGFHLTTLDSLKYLYKILNADKTTRAVYCAKKGVNKDPKSQQ